jgi:hypothetical protein
MATQNRILSREGQGAQWLNTSIDLNALELHDFSDLHSADHRPNHMLRWVLAIAAVLLVSHLVVNTLGGPSEMLASLTGNAITARL